MFDVHSPAHRRVAVIVGVLVAAAAVVVLTLVVTHRSPPDARSHRDAGLPVVLVPGYGGGTNALDVLADALRADGRFTRVVELGGASLDDLNRQADLVDAAVKDTLRESGTNKVDIVAYSAGGIAVRLWAADPEHSSQARRVVTLSTPNHGTDVSPVESGLGPPDCPKACEQLLAGSTFMKSLAEHDTAPTGPDWVSIWTDQDEVVVPPTSAVLEGALDFSVQSVCPGATVAHQGMPGNRVVVAMVRSELGSVAPRKPDSSVCTARPGGTPSS
jgi:triacylglycerol esterase/lipase EstA (alpha/beta hydrolase family)